jgi:hypothetical protein
MPKPFRCAPIVAALFASTLAAAPALAADRIKQPAKPAAKTAPAKPAFTVADASPDQVKAAELDQNVSVVQSTKYPAYADVKFGNGTWLMKPVLSSTGAIRLEDVRGQTLMVQIAAKSMLLDVKAGKRLVDDCICPKQRELVAEAKSGKAAAEAAPLKAVVEAGTAAGTGTTSSTK